MKMFSKLNKREGIYIIIIVALLVMLIVKSLWIDPCRPNDPEQSNFAYWVQNTAIPQEFGDGVFSKYILVSRLIKISEKQDKDGNDIYMAKIRRYLFGFLPVQEKKLVALKNKFN